MRRALQGAACSWQGLLLRPPPTSMRPLAFVWPYWPLFWAVFMLSGIATLAITL